MRLLPAGCCCCCSRPSSIVVNNNAATTLTAAAAGPPPLLPAGARPSFPPRPRTTSGPHLCSSGRVCAPPPIRTSDDLENNIYGALQGRSVLARCCAPPKVNGEFTSLPVRFWVGGCRRGTETNDERKRERGRGATRSRLKRSGPPRQGHDKATATMGARGAIGASGNEAWQGGVRE